MEPKKTKKTPKNTIAEKSNYARNAKKPKKARKNAKT